MTIEDIIHALPTKEDLARQIGLQTQTSSTSALGVFGIGVLLGAGLALLFAPKPGTELRQDIAGKVGEVTERLGRSAEEAHAPNGPQRA